LGIEIPGHLSEMTGNPIFRELCRGNRLGAALGPALGLAPS